MYSSLRTIIPLEWNYKQLMKIRRVVLSQGKNEVRLEGNWGQDVLTKQCLKDGMLYNSPHSFCFLVTGTSLARAVILLFTYSLPEAGFRKCEPASHSPLKFFALHTWDREQVGDLLPGPWLERHLYFKWMSPFRWQIRFVFLCLSSPKALCLGIVSFRFVTSNVSPRLIKDMPFPGDERRGNRPRPCLPPRWRLTHREHVSTVSHPFWCVGSEFTLNDPCTSTISSPKYYSKQKTEGRKISSFQKERENDPALWVT